MITETITVKKFDYDELTEAAKKHARNTPDAHEIMAYEINEELSNLFFIIDDFNTCTPAALRVFDAHGPGTEKVDARKCDFFDAVEYINSRVDYGYISEYSEIAEAYNKCIDEHSEELSKLLENIDIAFEESENTPNGQPDYSIYEVIELQDQFASIFDEALEAAASEANDIIEGIRDIYVDEWELDELLRCFWWTEEGEYIEAL